MKSNSVLHVCQVCWIGSVPIFIGEIARAFPELHHVMVHLHDSMSSIHIIDRLQLRGVEVSHAPLITKRLVEEINPIAIIFHGTIPKSLEQPMDWLSDWPTLMFYHGRGGMRNVRGPLIKTRKTLFVSRTIFNRAFKHRAREFGKYGFCPPCIDTGPYEALERSPTYKDCTIGRLQTDSPGRHPPQVIEIFKRVQAVVPSCRFTIVGGAKYYKDTGLRNLEMPAVGSMLPQSFYRHFDVLLLRNFDGGDDTWSRVVTEGMASGLPVVAENRGGPTEQIAHGEDGFLFDNDDQCVDILCRLITHPDLRYMVGMAAREKAVRHFGLERLRKELGSFMLKAALEAS